MAIPRTPGRVRPLIAFLALCVSVLGLAGCSSNTTDDVTVTNPKAPTVALSNSFTGNIWRQTMVNKFADAAKDAQIKGLISDFKVYNAPGNNSATEQITQIKSQAPRRLAGHSELRARSDPPPSWSGHCRPIAWRPPRGVKIGGFRSGRDEG